jgi:hypothetical protein
MAICPYHNKVVTRVCFFEDCGDNLICNDCTQDMHKHPKTPKDALELIGLCPLHKDQRMIQACVDPLCKVPARLGCTQCMTEFHQHRPIEVCELHMKRFTKLCVSKECQNTRSASCDVCVEELHNHNKQDFIDIEHFKSLYLEIYEMPSSIEEIRYEKNTLREVLRDFFRKTKTSLDTKFTDSARFLEANVVNKKYSDLDHDTKMSMDKVKNSLFPDFSPAQARVVYTSLIKSKVDEKPMEEIKSFCSQMVEVRAMLTELEKVVHQLDNSALFRKYSSGAPTLQSLQPLKQFIEIEDRKWNLSNYHEAEKVSLMDSRPTEVIDAKHNFEERIRRKMEPELAESDAGSITSSSKCPPHQAQHL